MKKNFLLIVFFMASSFAVFSQTVPQEKKVVITKIGATWCPNCGTTAWDNFTTLYEEYGQRAVLLSIHPSGSSSLHSAESSDFAQNLPQAHGQPLFYINREKYSTNSILSKAGEAIAAAASDAPVANAGVTATFTDQRLNVAAKVQFFQESEGEYYLSLLIIEDGVIARQSNRGDDANHKKILRSSFTGGTFGQPIANGMISADATYTFSDSKTLNSDWNTDNLEVAAIIWKKVGDDYEFINANTVAASFSTAINYLEKAGVHLSIAPTLLQETATVRLESPIHLDRTTIAIYNSAGQAVKPLFSGAVQTGVQHFTIQKTDLPASGIYFLRMESNGSVMSRKLVVE